MIRVTRSARETVVARLLEYIRQYKPFLTLKIYPPRSKVIHRYLIGVLLAAGEML